MEFDLVQICFMEMEGPAACGLQRFYPLPQIRETHNGRGRVHAVADQMKVDMSAFSDTDRPYPLFQGIKLSPAAIEQSSFAIREHFQFPDLSNLVSKHQIEN